MKDTDNNFSPLTAAIFDWVRRHVPAALSAALTWDIGSHRDFFPIQDDYGASQALENIRKLLGKDSPIKTLEELDLILRTALTTALTSDDGTPKEITSLTAEEWLTVFSQVAARLEDPVRTWSFSVPIAVSAQFELAHTLSDQPHLILETKSASQGPIRVFLCGTLQATSEHRAKFLVEDHVRAIVGLCFALGIVGVIPLPSPLTIILDLVGESAHQLPLHPSVAGLLPRVFFCMPTTLDSLDETYLKQARTSDLVSKRLRPLLHAMRIRSQRSRELQNGAALLFDALASRDEGSGIAFALMSMEAVLLDKSDAASTVARLSEAVTYRLGASARERSIYRKAVKDLYNSRSTFVHTGRLDPHVGDRGVAVHMAKDVLYRELLGFLADEPESRQPRPKNSAPEP